MSSFPFDDTPKVVRSIKGCDMQRVEGGFIIVTKHTHIHESGVSGNVEQVPHVAKNLKEALFIIETHFKE